MKADNLRIKKATKFNSSKNNHAVIRVAIAGNPNAGKTSLFNALTGQSQHVGNYPGVTVEKKSGRVVYNNYTIELIDLPGTYSLSAYSIEEIVARDFVLQDKPDVIIDVLDSTNLERNLYLCLQFQELGVPLVGALNMADEAEKLGLQIDDQLLSKILGIPFVKTIGSRGIGKEALLNHVIELATGQISSTDRHLNYGRELETEHNKLIEILGTDGDFIKRYNSHWMAIKLLEDDKDAAAKIAGEHQNAEIVRREAEKSRVWIGQHFGEDSEVVVGEQRYAYIHGACREAVTTTPDKNRIDHTELIDKIVLDRYLGLLIFFSVMFLIYQLTFALGNPISDKIDEFFAFLQNVLLQQLHTGILQDFLVEGIIGGVGGVLVFFPIVLFLFLGLSFLEDTGYMARAAFVMDKFMHIFGLHGRSFIPMMVSTGCAVPGVMSARTLVNPKDRILTIMVSPLMMCGAKVPVIAMLAAAFFPKNAATVFWGIWLFGWILALVLALIFRKVFFKGEASPFVMELPPYRMPTVRGVLTHMWEKSWSYVKKAGTFILAASVVIWFILYFPKLEQHDQKYSLQENQLLQQYQLALTRLDSTLMRHPDFQTEIGQRKTRLTENYHLELQQLENQIALEELGYSFGGRFGRLIEPVFRTCGFDWRLDVTLIAGFAAKEVIVSSMGIIYGLGEANAAAETTQPEIKTPLKEKLGKDPHYNQLNMLAFMLFVLIYIPCMATLAAVKKELGKWKYPIFLAAYTLGVAWLLATVVFQLGTILGLG
jgi:ferrous iron transport protein B